MGFNSGFKGLIKLNVKEKLAAAKFNKLNQTALEYTKKKTHDKNIRILVSLSC